MTVELSFYDGRPAWKIHAPNPDRFAGVEYKIEFRLFRLPQGALIAAWLRLYDIPDQPFFLHRVLDAGDGAARAYLEKMAEASQVVLMFDAMGEQEGFAIELPVRGGALKLMLEEAGQHRSSLASSDGQAALEAFTSVFDPALKRFGSCEGAWDEVDRKYPRPSSMETRHERKAAKARGADAGFWLGWTVLAAAFAAVLALARCSR